MSELDFKKLQLSCINNSIEALFGVVNIPAQLKYQKIILEKEIIELENNKPKVFDQQLIKE